MTHTSPESPEGTEPGSGAPRDPAAPAAPDEQTQAHAAGAPTAWAWAKPPEVLQTVETEPLEYHRLYRGAPKYRWWKPLLVLVLAAVFYAVFSVIISGIWLGIIAADNPELFTSADPLATADEVTAQLMLDTQNPLSVFMNLFTVILMIPSVLLAMLSLGMRPMARVWSVATRIRWGLLGRTIGIAVLAVIVMNLVGMATEYLINPATISEPVAQETQDFSWNAALISMLLVLILVPFQATAEELVFRGLFMQVLGSWLKNPWFAILIPSVGFALAHIYNIWGLAAVGLMGVAAAWLTWRTGGLEAAIAIHVVNNLVAFGFMSAGVGGETAQTADSGGVGTLVGEIFGLALFAWMVTRSFRKHGYGRTRIDLVQVAVPAPMSAPMSQTQMPLPESGLGEGQNSGEAGGHGQDARHD